MKNLNIGLALLVYLLSFDSLSKPWEQERAPVVLKADKGNYELMARCAMLAEISGKPKSYADTFANNYMSYTYKDKSQRENVLYNYGYEIGYVAALVDLQSDARNLSRKEIAQQYYSGECEKLTL